MKTNAISKFYEECHKFNDVAGKLDGLTIRDVHNQLVLLKEELDEGFEAYLAGDMEALLDAHVDVSVVSAGLGFILEKLGFNVDGALLETANNNLTKFIEGSDCDLVDKTIQHYKDQGIETEAVYNSDHDLFVIKDKNNKIRKPLGFVSNSLVQFLPEQVKQKA